LAQSSSLAHEQFWSPLFQGISAMGTLVLPESEDAYCTNSSSDGEVSPMAYAISTPTVQGSFAHELQAASVTITGRSGKFWTVSIATVEDSSDDAPSLAYIISRRYSEFKALDRQLRPRVPELPLLPAQSAFFRKTFKPGFMEERRCGLESYIEALLKDPATLRDPAVCTFLGLGR